MTQQYIDYRYNFPASGLALAVEALGVLRAAGILGQEDFPANMLGGPLELNGAVVAMGRQGRAALSYVDADTGQTVNVAAVGDPTRVYIHIRSTTTPSELPVGFDPATYGLLPTPPSVSTAVLGVWA